MEEMLANQADSSAEEDILPCHKHEPFPLLDCLPLENCIAI